MLHCADDGEGSKGEGGFWGGKYLGNSTTHHQKLMLVIWIKIPFFKYQNLPVDLNTIDNLYPYLLNLPSAAPIKKKLIKAI